MNSLTYKGYTGHFSYEPGDEAFHGTVAGLRDVIHFTGRSVDELRASLAEGVEDYLAMCAEDGVEPEKPFPGRFALRMEPDLHRRAAMAAKSAGKSLNAWIAQAVRHELLSEDSPRK